MITCVVDCVIDLKKIDALDKFANRWIDLVNRYGGRNPGYFLPSEGASDRALGHCSSASNEQEVLSMHGTQERGSDA
jgi:hypothetical protein